VSEMESIPPSSRERWLSAICYTGIGVLVTMLARDRTPFVARHARQGFALLFAEIVSILVIGIVDATLGALPILGFLLVVILRLVVYGVALVISVLGFTKAIFGESWRIPYLDEWAYRIPVD